MGDTLWHFMNNNKLLKRDQLELVIQKKKLNEVHSWFLDHFVNTSQLEYISRCPIVIIQGPTGCGKTSTLRWISNELKIPIKEFSEITDTTAINYNLSKSSYDDDRDGVSQLPDRRKAIRFEHFVINSIIYNPLYPNTESVPQVDEAASEFDSDDDFIDMTATAKHVPKPSGVIIHIESPLTFARSQRVLLQTLFKLLKVLNDLSSRLLRRVAIVFETLENEGDSLSLPNKIKASLGIQVFKFNSITRANMKKFVDALMKVYPQFIIDKETVELLINDCDGDIRACINTFQLLCNKSTRNHVLNGINNNTPLSNRCFGNELINPPHLPASKKQKLNPDKVRQFKLNPSLMRDVTKSVGFFHTLGKIFYQKRLYPDLNVNRQHRCYRSIDRPYPTENSTEYLASLLEIEPKNLIAWLHQHYYKFCVDDNIDKAALFLENLSTVENISIDSTQSSQFYESHYLFDPLQTHLAIEATVYSLYSDQSRTTKPSHKKIQTNEGYRFIKTSVDNQGNGGFGPGEMQSFNKPTSQCIPRLIDGQKKLLELCADRTMSYSSARLDSTKALIDYIPYINHIYKNYHATPQLSQFNSSSNNTRLPIFDEPILMKAFEFVGKLESDTMADYERKQEQISELIEDCEKLTMFS